MIDSFFRKEEVLAACQAGGAFIFVKIFWLEAGYFSMVPQAAAGQCATGRYFLAMKKFFALAALCLVHAFPAEAETPSVNVTPPAADSSRVTVLCYHRFEDSPRDGLAISPADFRAEMQKLKDDGIAVVGMDDFLAWRRGEKSLPERAAVITIDDGYRSGYEVAWPILKEFGYPFTMFIYTEYVKGGAFAGGGSLTWQELAEMRDAGVDIGSHSLTHGSLTSTKGRTPEEQEAWVRAELLDSKKILEEKLGMPVPTFAYPYGHENERVRELAKEAGYEAAFTVRGQKLTPSGDPMAIGRYAIDSKQPEVFAMATNFGTSVAATSSPNATGAHPVTPDPGTQISGPLPEIGIDLAGASGLDPTSLVMRIGGLGEVPAVFNPETRMFSYTPQSRIYAPEVRVSVSGRADGRRFESRWAYPTAIAME
jgi:peptidoglycan/xylan/chitin deacetylase (PgdA/CDA1 family)